MAANFDFVPQYVTPKKSYSVYQTPAETPGKKEALLVDDNPDISYELQFKNQTQAQYEDMLAHYDDCFGSWATFTWINPPNQINHGAAMTVRYAKDNSFVEKPIEAGNWEIKITLEVVN